MNVAQIHVKMEGNARTTWAVTLAHVRPDTKASNAKQASYFLI